MSLRKLMRSVARKKLEKTGATGFNKKKGKEPSFFSQHWREIALTPDPPFSKKRKKSNKEDSQ